MKDGGSAFPKLIALHNMSRMSGRDSFDAVTEEGMTLRDYFAAQAVTAIINLKHETVRLEGHLEFVADQAYRVADAMLKAREAK